MLRFFFLLFSLCASLHCLCQNKKPKKDYSLDTNFVRSYSKYVTLSVYTISPVMNMTITPLIDTLVQYRSAYEGSFSGSIGFGIDYKALSVSYAFNVPIDTNQFNSKGQSSAYVLGVKIKQNPLIFSADYRRYKGYFDSNPRIYNKDLSDSIVYFRRPDLTYRHYSANIIYSPRCRKYSYTAPLTYTNRQMRTNYGFMLKGNFTYLKLYADSSIVSTIKKAYFMDFHGVYKMDALVLKGGSGLGVNFVFFKRAYFAFSLFVMTNYLQYRYGHSEERISRWRSNVNIFTEGNIGFGFNAERFYVGLRSSGDSNAMRVKGAKINITYGAVFFDIGYRFNSPKWLDKLWEKTATKYFNL